MIDEHAFVLDGEEISAAAKTLDSKLFRTQVTCPVHLIALEYS